MNFSHWYIGWLVKAGVLVSRAVVIAVTQLLKLYNIVRSRHKSFLLLFIFSTLSYKLISSRYNTYHAAYSNKLNTNSTNVQAEIAQHTVQTTRIMLTDTIDAQIQELEQKVQQSFPHSTIVACHSGRFIEDGQFIGQSQTTIIEWNDLQHADIIICPLLPQDSLDALLNLHKIIIMYNINLTQILPQSQEYFHITSKGEVNYDDGTTTFTVNPIKYNAYYTPNPNSIYIDNSAYNSVRHFINSKYTNRIANTKVTKHVLSDLLMANIFTPYEITGKFNTSSYLNRYDDGSRGVIIQQVNDCGENEIYYAFPGTAVVHNTNSLIASLMREHKDTLPQTTFGGLGIVSAALKDAEPEIMKYVNNALIPNLTHINDNIITIGLHVGQDNATIYEKYDSPIFSYLKRECHLLKNKINLYYMLIRDLTVHCYSHYAYQSYYHLRFMEATAFVSTHIKNLYHKITSPLADFFVMCILNDSAFYHILPKFSVPTSLDLPDYEPEPVGTEQQPFFNDDFFRLGNNHYDPDSHYDQLLDIPIVTQPTTTGDILTNIDIQPAVSPPSPVRPHKVEESTEPLYEFSTNPNSSVHVITIDDIDFEIDPQDDIVVNLAIIISALHSHFSKVIMKPKDKIKVADHVIYELLGPHILYTIHFTDIPYYLLNSLSSTNIITQEHMDNIVTDHNLFYDKKISSVFEYRDGVAMSDIFQILKYNVNNITEGMEDEDTRTLIKEHLYLISLYTEDVLGFLYDRILEVPPFAKEVKHALKQELFKQLHSRDGIQTSLLTTQHMKTDSIISTEPKYIDLLEASTTTDFTLTTAQPIPNRDAPTVLTRLIMLMRTHGFTFTNLLYTYSTRFNYQNCCNTLLYYCALFDMEVGSLAQVEPFKVFMSLYDRNGGLDEQLRRKVNVKMYKYLDEPDKIDTTTLNFNKTTSKINNEKSKILENKMVDFQTPHGSHDKPLMRTVNPILSTEIDHIHGYTKGSFSTLNSHHSRIFNDHIGPITEQHKQNFFKRVTALYIYWIREANDVSLVPKTVEQYAESCNTTNKKHRLEKLQQDQDLTIYATGTKPSVFIKQECADKDELKCRNITAVPSNIIVETSCYVQTFNEWFKRNFPCYGFRTATYISEVITYLSKNSDTITEGDFSAFDGTQSIYTLIYEAIPYSVVFHKPLEEIIDMLLKGNKLLYTATPHLKLSSGTTRQSGSAQTSMNNTLVNFSFQILAQIFQGTDEDVDLTNFDNYGFEGLKSSHKDAGDDSLAFDIKLSWLQHECDIVGIKLKGKETTPDQPVSYLARIFANPSADPGSAINLRRDTIKTAAAPINSNPLNIAQTDKLMSRIVNEGGNNEIMDKQIKILTTLNKDYHTTTKLVDGSSVHKAFQGQALPVNESSLIGLAQTQDIRSIHMLDALSDIDDPDEILEQLRTLQKTGTIPDDNMHQLASRYINYCLKESNYLEETIANNNMSIRSLLPYGEALKSIEYIIDKIAPMNNEVRQEHSFVDYTPMNNRLYQIPKLEYYPVYKNRQAMDNVVRAKGSLIRKFTKQRYSQDLPLPGHRIYFKIFFNDNFERVSDDKKASSNITLDITHFITGINKQTTKNLIPPDDETFIIITGTNYTAPFNLKLQHVYHGAYLNIFVHSKIKFTSPYPKEILKTKAKLSDVSKVLGEIKDPITVVARKIIQPTAKFLPKTQAEKEIVSKLKTEKQIGYELRIKNKEYKLKQHEKDKQKEKQRIKQQQQEDSMFNKIEVSNSETPEPTVVSAFEPKQAVYKHTRMTKFVQDDELGKILIVTHRTEKTHNAQKQNTFETNQPYKIVKKGTSTTYKFNPNFNIEDDDY